MHKGHIVFHSFVISHSSDGPSELISTGRTNDRLLKPQTITTFGQESTDGGVIAEADSAIVRLGSSLRAAELSQEVRANGPIWLVGNHGLRVDLIKKSQPGFGSANFGVRRGACDRTSDRRRELHELIVERSNGGRVSATCVSTFSVD